MDQNIFAEELKHIHNDMVLLNDRLTRLLGHARGPQCLSLNAAAFKLTQAEIAISSMPYYEVRKET